MFFFVVFFRWDLKTPGIKTREYESQAKKGSDCNFYSFSLLVPCSNTFLVPCTCTLIFHSINSHLPTTIFLCEGLISFFFFFVSCSYELGKFQISWGPSVLGGPNFLFGRGVGRPISSIKPSRPIT